MNSTTTDPCPLQANPTRWATLENRYGWILSCYGCYRAWHLPRNHSPHERRGHQREIDQHSATCEAGR
jgi:hypothetical protein